VQLLSTAIQSAGTEEDHTQVLLLPMAMAPCEPAAYRLSQLGVQTLADTVVRADLVM